MVPVSCKICIFMGDGSKFSTLDDQKAHAQFHASKLAEILNYDGEEFSLKDIFGKCFPLEDFEKPKEMEKSRTALAEIKNMTAAKGKEKDSEKSRLALSVICKNIIKTKQNDSNSIECQICESKVQYVKKNSDNWQMYLLLRHASEHSSKKPFVCRECQHESMQKSDVCDHVKRVHKIGSPVSGVHFDENWIACFDEVKESLEKCFGKEDDK